MSIKKTITLLSSSQKGTANGVAELSTTGTVPASQLPSYVDDVIEGTMNSEETIFTDMDNRVITPENGKIYVDNNTNKTYRWSGKKYIVIASDLALGETNSTAYAGNKGKALADKLGTTDISSIGSTVTEAITNLNTDKLNKTGDSKDNTATFTSSDVADGSSTAWTTVPALTSGEKHTSIFSKMSQMFKNIRYLYKMLGTTDISAIGDGTATGAISSLNSNLSERQYIYGTKVQFFNEGSYINALCIICEIGIDSSNTDVKYIEGTFTFINHQYENNTGASEYYKYTTDVHFDKHNQSISLFSSNTYGLKPVIVKYTNPSDETDIHYYLSLLFTRGSIRWNHICFNGITNINMEGRYIKYSGSTLPDGYTIYQEPLPMRKLNLVSGYIGNDSASYSYDQIKALEDRITALENK